MTIYKDYEDKREPIEEKQDFNETIMDESEILGSPMGHNKEAQL